MRRCYKCGLEKPLDQFRVSKRQNGSTKYKECRDCYRAYMREYMANRTREQRDRHNATNRANAAAKRVELGLPEIRVNRTKIMRELVIERKSVPCSDCGVSYPSIVMDFDHVRGSKLFTISSHLSGKRAKGTTLCTIEEFIEELDKCDVVCSNCHRLRTAARHSAGGTAQRRGGRRKDSGREAGSLTE